MLNESGMGEMELAGIPFRFANDLQLVVSEKKLVSLADYIHQCSVSHGFADFELINHVVTQKQYPPVTWMNFCVFFV